MRRATLCSAALMVILILTSGGTARAQDADVVIQWDRITQDTVATPGAIPPTIFFTRSYAMAHVAMFEAINSIDRRYRPYLAYVEAAPGASRSAAAAQAAHDVLVALAPSLQATLDAALSVSLAGLPAEAARDGSRTGAAAARAILEQRADDGWSRVPPAFILPEVPGYWQPTPPANAAAAFTTYPDVLPFAVPDRLRFLMEAPPALTSERYAADFNATKAIGAVSSPTRTPDQTQAAQVWAGVGTTTGSSRVWHVVVQDRARDHGLSDLQTARLFALVAIATHDAFFTSFNGKYLYGLWRPVTAIRQADRDGNANTERDAGWTPLIATPPYPTYPGNAACHGAASSQVLARFFDRDDIPYTFTWQVPNGAGITRSYAGFRHMADEQASSRVWGGIHFAFDTTASFGVCTELADYVFDNFLRPR